MGETAAFIAVVKDAAINAAGQIGACLSGNAGINQWYGGFQRKIRHIVHIMQTPEVGEVSRGGDSGSWWLDVATHKAAALHVAGNDDPEYALAISMPHVLEALQVDI